MRLLSRKRRRGRGTKKDCLSGLMPLEDLLDLSCGYRAGARDCPVSKTESMPSALEGERFDAVKGIVGRIAHDFNNLLTPLLAYPPLIRNDLPEGSCGASLLDVIEKTAQDMLHITRQLLELSGHGEYEFHLADLNEIVERTAAEAGAAAAAAGVTIQKQLSTPIPHVSACAERVVLALRNVLRNAFEAMPRGGEIVIATREQTVGGENAGPDAPAPGRYVVVDVCDRGEGVPVDLGRRIFEPFVSTRRSAERRGAGLGLSVAYRIVRDHGGYIAFAAREGGGTVFSLFFPVAEGAGSAARQTDARSEEAAQPQSSDPAPTACDRNRILIVDDETNIIRLFRMILLQEIPDLIADMASRGGEALRIFESGHHAVVLMDIRMPDMDGLSCFEEMQKICAARRWEMPAVIFCTGFSVPPAVRQIINGDSKHALLAKPVSREQLVQTVRARLFA